MKKLNYILITIITLSALFTISCGGSKYEDFEAPKISEVRFNVNDMVLYDYKNPNNPKETKTDTLFLNDSLKDPSKPDTLVIGHSILINALLTDDKGLSAVVVRIWGDTLPEFNLEDTCYRVRRVPQVGNISGKTTAQLTKIKVEDVLPTWVSRKNGNEQLKVRTSIAENNEYYFSIRCTDLGGNEDSTSYKKHPIVIVTRETVLRDRGIIVE